MIAVLVHHSDAVGPAIDPQRPLSELGLRQAATLAAQARAAGVLPVVIWHSGKLRARQTADAFLRACNPMADVRMVRGLRPEDPPEWMRDELGAETRDVLLVGHMPHLAALARSLSPDAGEFPLNGVVAFSRSGDRSWTELWRLAPPRT
jgi:phosphohistidine phosphatase